MKLSKVTMLARTSTLMGGRYVWYNSPLPFSVIFLTYIKNYTLFQTFPHLVMFKITSWALFWWNGEHIVFCCTACFVYLNAPNVIGGSCWPGATPCSACEWASAYCQHWEDPWGKCEIFAKNNQQSQLSSDCSLAPPRKVLGPGGKILRSLPSAFPLLHEIELWIEVLAECNTLSFSQDFIWTPSSDSIDRFVELTCGHVAHRWIVDASDPQHG